MNIGDFEFGHVTEIFVFPHDTEIVTTPNFNDVFLIPMRFFNCVRIIPSTSCKGTGFAAAIKDTEYQLDQAIAIGDGRNDVTLFQKCAKGISVLGSSRELEEVADLRLTETLSSFLLKYSGIGD
ncbi:HAD hydrolase family protein [Paenibacillus sp. YYML68]|uniref:HAD hydrolase family protein n=1 Tax=Paenibacillus sp. YYML68 TaxID=2909250 RepID=UPI002492F284|nr:HAD hydrolase family protein [Paenibacillus sp. YYML68]